MFHSLLNPTEESMHNLALYLALLEQHDPATIPTKQLVLLVPFLKHLKGNQNVLFSRRYDLKKRSKKLYYSFIHTANNKPSESSPVKLASTYARQLAEQHLRTNHLADPSLTVATDAEMRADIAMRLDRVQQIPLEQRVFSLLPESAFREMLGGIFSYIVSCEAIFLASDLGIVDKEYISLHARDSIYRLAVRANETPEIIETREATRAMNLDSDVMHKLDMNDSTPLHQQPDQKPKSLQQPDENDQLARTAGELLEKLASNKTSKFQNSAFLSLMRRVRDKEVRVEGEDMIDVKHSMVDEAKPDYVPPLTTAQTQPVEQARSRVMNDGQEVVDLLSQPPIHDEDSEFMMTSPFYDNEHAELGRRGLFYE